MPFTELIKNPCYKNSVLKMMGSVAGQIPSDTINLQEEHPRICIGFALADKTEKDSSLSPPFYITLIVHDQMIHNCLLDSGSSHNFMHKAVVYARNCFQTTRKQANIISNISIKQNRVFRVFKVFWLRSLMTRGNAFINPNKN